jgi:hypothetical protein
VTEHPLPEIVQEELPKVPVPFVVNEMDSPAIDSGYPATVA